MGVLIVLCFIDFHLLVFVLASNMSYFTAFSREIDVFYSRPSTPPASFSTSPASPTNCG